MNTCGRTKPRCQRTPPSKPISAVSSQGREPRQKHPHGRGEVQSLRRNQSLRKMDERKPTQRFYFTNAFAATLPNPRQAAKPWLLLGHREQASPLPLLSLCRPLPRLSPTKSTSRPPKSAPPSQNSSANPASLKPQIVFAIAFLPLHLFSLSPFLSSSMVCKRTSCLGKA